MSFVETRLDSLSVLLCEAGHDEAVRVEPCQGDELGGAVVAFLRWRSAVGEAERNVDRLAWTDRIRTAPPVSGVTYMRRRAFVSGGENEAVSEKTTGCDDEASGDDERAQSTTLSPSKRKTAS